LKRRTTVENEQVG